MEVIQLQFGIGLAVGLLVALAVAVQAAAARAALRREIGDLRSHLQRQMEITGAGQRAQADELEDLRSRNENLRSTIATLRQKPGRAELRALAAMDRAVRLMQARAPGFAPAWEGALAEAERELLDAERGLLPLLRRVFGGLGARSRPPPAEPGGDGSGRGPGEGT
jgi:cell division protein FtsB